MPTITIHPKFNIGDIVFIVTDPEQLQRIVTAITIRPNGGEIFTVSCGDLDSNHYGIELETDKSFKL